MIPLDWRWLLVGAVCGWLAGYWRHRPARARRRARERAIREATATVNRAGVILRDEMDKIQRAIEREKLRRR